MSPEISRFPGLVLTHHPGMTGHEGLSALTIRVYGGSTFTSHPPTGGIAWIRSLYVKRVVRANGRGKGLDILGPRLSVCRRHLRKSAAVLDGKPDRQCLAPGRAFQAFGKGRSRLALPENDRSHSGDPRKELIGARNNHWSTAWSILEVTRGARYGARDFRPFPEGRQADADSCSPPRRTSSNAPVGEKQESG